jgi:hypothetical protein
MSPLFAKPLRCIQWFDFWMWKTFPLPKSITILSKCIRKVSWMKGMWIPGVVWRSDAQNGTRSGCPSVITKDLKDRVDAHVCDNRQLTVYELHEVFPCVSRSVYEIVTVQLQHRKTCDRWVKKWKKQLQIEKGVWQPNYMIRRLSGLCNVWKNVWTTVGLHKKINMCCI